MKKINLFIILAFEKQTYKYNDIVNDINKNLDFNKKTMESTLSMHYSMISKYFNIYNFYEYKDKIETFDNAVIYHLPFGKDNIETGIEEKLLKFKGKVPIVFRSYDAHSPLKTSIEYMDRYHDFVITYISQHVNSQGRVFANLSFDNHLVKQYEKIPEKRNFACMILRKETREEYFEDTNKFKEKGLDLIKSYELRTNIVQYEQIDIYGRNWPQSMKNYKGTLNPHINKYITLNQYKFNFIVENVIVDNYISEKILDSFISLSIPVYLGSPTVEKYIPKSCFVDMRDFESNDELVKYLENMPEKEYKIYIENIKKHREKIFDEFSTKNNFAKPVYKWYKENYNNDLEYSDEFFENVEKDILSKKFDDGLTMKIRLKNFIRQSLLYFQKARA